MPSSTKKTTFRNLWTILCSSSAIDRDSNTISLFDVLEELTITVEGKLIPHTAFPINMSLFGLWERDSAGEDVELKVRLALKAPDNTELNSMETVIKMDAKNVRARLRAQIQGIELTESGKYTYEITSLEPEKTAGVKVITAVSVMVKVIEK